MSKLEATQQKDVAGTESYVSGHFGTFRSRWQIQVIVACYALSRAAFWSLGVRFSSTEVEGFWQYLDTTLLKHQMWTSLLYLHSQPPLMNLYYGILFQAFPTHWPMVAYGLNLLLGLLAYLAIYTIMIRNSVPRAIALCVVIVALCNPSAVVYEAEPFYTHTAFCLLVFAAYFFDKYLRLSGIGACAGFLGTLTALSLWRASYQLAWYLLIAFWLVRLTPARLLRRVVILASIFGCLIGALYLKNWILFGSFNSSSASGMSLAKSWSGPRAMEFVREGKLSPISGVPAPDSMDKYLPVIGPQRKTGVRALDAVFKDNGSMNLNNIGYPEVSGLYTKDYLRLLKLSPKTVAEQGARSWLDYFRPNSVWIGWFDRQNQSSVEVVDLWYRYLFCSGAEYALDSDIGSKDHPGTQEEYLHRRLRAVCWQIVAVYVMLAAFLVSVPFQRWLTANDRLQRPLLLFMISTVAYNAILSNAVEVAENMRYRFEVQGLVLAAATIICYSILSRLSNHRDGARSNRVTADDSRRRE